MKEEDFAPVFITGVSRTGSKIYLNTIKNNSDIDITYEVHYINPWFLHRDFIRKSKKFGDLRNDSNVTQLVEAMFSNTFFGTFWKDEVPALDRESIKKNILASDRSMRAIFIILLEEHMKKNKKSFPGAKYPSHFSKIPIMLQWFPNSKIIHTTRDPRAVYYSQKKKRQFGIYQNNIFYRAFLDIIMFFHVVMSFWWISFMHSRLKNGKNYYVVVYEKIISSPKSELINLCNFLNIDFKNEMLYPPVSDSSFIKGKKTGFRKESIDKWKTGISSITANLLYFLCKPVYQKFLTWKPNQ